MAAGSTANKHLVTLQRMSQSGPRAVGLYSNRQRILLVGEADFSFALCLASALGGGDIVATSFMRESQLQVVYGTGVSGTIGALSSLGASVYHSVDGTKLSDYEFMNRDAASTFSRIVWHFPDNAEPPVDKDERRFRPDNGSNRKGRPTPKSKADRQKDTNAVKEDEEEDKADKRALVNAELLGDFLTSAAGFLRDEESEIHVTLPETQVKRLSDGLGARLAKDANLKVMSIERMDVSVYDGYKPLHNYPKTPGLLSLTPASTLVFRRAAGTQEKGGKRSSEAAEDEIDIEDGDEEDHSTGERLGGARWERKVLAADKRSKKKQKKMLRAREESEWVGAGRDMSGYTDGDVGTALSAVAYLLG